MNSYALEFIHEFDSIGKTTYFSYGYPYTYTQHLGGFVDTVFAEPKYLK